MGIKSSVRYNVDNLDREYTVESGKRPVLIVEDSDEDFTVLTRVLSKLGITNPLLRCANGEECLELLRRGEHYNDQTVKMPNPAIILLDLNMHGVDGRSVLKEIKANPKLRTIPVTILTTSNDPKDIQDCYDRGANAYIVKPLDYMDLMTSMRTATDFWLHTTQIP